MSSNKKSSTFRYVRIFVSLALFVIIFYYLDWHRILDAFYQSRKRILLYAFSLHFIGILVSVVRWNILLKAVGIHAKFKDLFILYWISLFYNIFLPGSIGGDVVRIYDLSKFTGNLNGSIASVVMDRLLGMIVLMMIAVAAVLAGVHLVFSQSLVLLVVLFLAGFAFILALLLLPNLRNTLSSLIPAKIMMLLQKKMTQMLDTFSLYRNSPRVLLVSVLWSFILQLNVIFYYYLIGKSLGVSLHFFYYCIAIPVAQVITLIPISLGGTGLREITFIGLFHQFKVSAESAFSLSILGFILAAIFNSFGGLLLLSNLQKYQVKSTNN